MRHCGNLIEGAKKAGGTQLATKKFSRWVHYGSETEDLRCNSDL